METGFGFLRERLRTWFTGAENDRQMVAISESGESPKALQTGHMDEMGWKTEPYAARWF
jgi:hypothetical protein